MAQQYHRENDSAGMWKINCAKGLRCYEGSARALSFPRTLQHQAQVSESTSTAAGAASAEHLRTQNTQGRVSNVAHLSR